MLRYKLVLAFFLVSGLTSLIYQVVWFRMLSLAFGNTAAAMSTVLCVFFTGLAIGSYLFGRLADRIEQKLLLYGLLEGGIGLYALLFPLALSSVSGTYLEMYSSGVTSSWLPVLRTLSCGALLLPPTILMGGTFPVIARETVPEIQELKKKISTLYFVNTAGAVAGTLLAGFFLIAALGIAVTTWLTAGLNILLLIGSAIAQRKTRRHEFSDYREQTSHPTSPVHLAADTTKACLAIAGTAISGFTSISYEIVWGRAFTSYFGSSIYSFSTVVAAFLIGIALGSFFYSKRSAEEALRGFAEIQLRVALSVVLFLVIFMKLPVFILWGLRSLPETFASYQMLQFALVLIVMFYTTFNLGAAFPAATAAYVDSMEKMGGSIGKLYAANTAGAILGALISGFFLIPAIGMEKTIWICFLLNLLLGFMILKVIKEMHRAAWIWIGVCMLLVAIVPKWNQNVLNYGIYSRAFMIAGKFQKETAVLPATAGENLMQQAGISLSRGRDRADQSAGPGDTRIIFFKEGRTSTVSVIEEDNNVRTLLINGKADASNKPLGDMRTQLLLAHLPMILSPRMPQSALVIGLGSGTTLGSMERYPLRQIDCVEIEPAVVEAADKFFRDVNRNALHDPRLRLIVTDGRNYVTATNKRYDVITSEPSNLWMAGCSNLFTREFFQLARNRLTPNGIMCQWIHLYQISPNDVRTFLKTFQSVFPHVSVWIDEPDMLALGSERPIIVNPKTIMRRLSVPILQAELAPSNLSRPDEFLPLFTADTEMVARFVAGAPINEDNRPILEFSAPKSMLEIHSRGIIRDLLAGKAYEQERN